MGTAGGDPLNATVPTQYPDFAALDRDLRYAHQVLNSENIYIYSLPGKELLKNYTTILIHL